MEKIIKIKLCQSNFNENVITIMAHLFIMLVILWKIPWGIFGMKLKSWDEGIRTGLATRNGMKS